MKLHTLYSDYIRIRFSLPLEPAHRNMMMAFGQYEDDSAALFFADHPDETFSGWISELRPKDPYYGSKPDWKPVLAEKYEQLNVYDEMILYYLLFTINSTLSVNVYNTYSAMNDFMKNYSFLQLSHLHDISRLDDGEKQRLRDFFFFFYLYAHPVNDETLHACSFHAQHLIHTKTGIHLKDYFAAYYDHYSSHRNKYGEQIVISAKEIHACKHLTLELLQVLEGRSNRLGLPLEKGLEPVIHLINDVDNMLKLYADDPAALFQIMRDLLAGSNMHTTIETNDNGEPNNSLINALHEDSLEKPVSYRDHCFTLLLQNYVSYVLFFDFEEIRSVVHAFQDTPEECSFILSKMFTDTIFLQRMLRQQQIDLAQYPEVTRFFDEDARQWYL
ncbi:hypothetical protein GCM10008014_44710 [Paenibacillus silvae]|uniref:Uncharacterized protein n=2 Tax=Paenibacillus silvae TaxID=1325358 RepID=A0ABQ1ZGI1_9BACL|nr:hypothetical protein GCM10008014_44710 [Paenibacillus silvae]